MPKGDELITRSEIIDLANSATEGRVKKLAVKDFLNLEIARLVNRRHYWWKKQLAQFTTTGGTATYDLSRGGLNLAPHLGQVIRIYNALHFSLTSFSLQESLRFYNTQAPALVYLGDSISQMRAINDTQTQGIPGAWFIQPGTTKTLRLSPIPNGEFPILVHYWATYSAPKDDIDEELPAFFPEQFTRAVLAGLLRVMFTYLFSQDDPRVGLAQANYNEALEELDNFKSPAIEEATDWRHSDPNVTVTATS